MRMCSKSPQRVTTHKRATHDFKKGPCIAGAFLFVFVRFACESRITQDKDVPMTQLSPEPAFELTFPPLEAEFLRSKYETAAAILEYGSGGSTLLAATLHKPCHSVESDAQWAAALNKALLQLSATPTARAMHIDIGPTKEWGYPDGTDHWAQYWRYPLEVWTENTEFQPDLVLIDGRMRKACFAATLLQTRKPVTVLVDDYTDRSYYHEIETLVPVNAIVGRMAEFRIAPGLLDATKLTGLIPWFFDIR